MGIIILCIMRTQKTMGVHCTWQNCFTLDSQDARNNYEAHKRCKEKKCCHYQGIQQSKEPESEMTQILELSNRDLNIILFIIIKKQNNKNVYQLIN